MGKRQEANLTLAESCGIIVGDSREGEGKMCKFYSIIHEEPEGGYSAEVPALPGCYTDGDTIEEVKRNLQEAIQLYLEVSEAKWPK